jgi:hypothetical protein
MSARKGQKICHPILMTNRSNFDLSTVVANGLQQLLDLGHETFVRKEKSVTMNER